MMADIHDSVLYFRYPESFCFGGLLDTEYDAFHYMNFDYFKGNIASDGAGELCIVVDGKKMSMNDLENLLSTHERFEIKIIISDGST
jgi:hypothetical protein